MSWEPKDALRAGRRFSPIYPEHGYCPECGDPIHNDGAHAEACSGPATPKFSPALLREMIQEEEEHIRGLDYMLTRHRTRLAWLLAVQRGTIKP